MRKVVISVAVGMNYVSDQLLPVRHVCLMVMAAKSKNKKSLDLLSNAIASILARQERQI